MPRRGNALWQIRLSDAHRKSGLSVYRVAKDLNLNANTVKKYVTEDLTVDMIPPVIKALVKFYGLEWDDAVTVIKADEDEDPEIKTLLAVPA